MGTLSAWCFSCVSCSAWPGMVRHGLTWSGMVRHGPAWPDMVRHYLTWSGMVRHCLAWSGMIDMAWSYIELRSKSRSAPCLRLFVCSDPRFMFEDPERLKAEIKQQRIIIQQNLDKIRQCVDVELSVEKACCIFSNESLLTNAFIAGLLLSIF